MNSEELDQIPVFEMHLITESFDATFSLLNKCHQL